MFTFDGLTLVSTNDEEGRQERQRQKRQQQKEEREAPSTTPTAMQTPLYALSKRSTHRPEDTKPAAVSPTTPECAQRISSAVNDNDNHYWEGDTTTMMSQRSSVWMEHEIEVPFDEEPISVLGSTTMSYMHMPPATEASSPRRFFDSFSFSDHSAPVSPSMPSSSPARLSSSAVVERTLRVTSIPPLGPKKVATADDDNLDDTLTSLYKNITCLSETAAVDDEEHVSFPYTFYDDNAELLCTAIGDQLVTAAEQPYTDTAVVTAEEDTDCVIPVDSSSDNSVAVNPVEEDEEFEREVERLVAECSKEAKVEAAAQTPKFAKVAVLDEIVEQDSASVADNSACSTRNNAPVVIDEKLQVERRGVEPSPEKAAMPCTVTPETSSPKEDPCVHQSTIPEPAVNDALQSTSETNHDEFLTPTSSQDAEPPTAGHDLAMIHKTEGVSSATMLRSTARVLAPSDKGTSLGDSNDDSKDSPNAETNSRVVTTETTGRTLDTSPLVAGSWAAVVKKSAALPGTTNTVDVLPDTTTDPFLQLEEIETLGVVQEEEDYSEEGDDQPSTAGDTSAPSSGTCDVKIDSHQSKSQATSMSDAVQKSLEGSNYLLSCQGSSSVRSDPKPISSRPTKIPTRFGNRTSKKEPCNVRSESSRCAETLVSAKECLKSIGSMHSESSTKSVDSPSGQQGCSSFPEKPDTLTDDKLDETGIVGKEEECVLSLIATGSQETAESSANPKSTVDQPVCPVDSTADSQHHDSCTVGKPNSEELVSSTEDGSFAPKWSVPTRPESQTVGHNVTSPDGEIGVSPQNIETTMLTAPERTAETSQVCARGCAESSVGCEQQIATQGPLLPRTTPTRLELKGSSSLAQCKRTLTCGFDKVSQNRSKSSESPHLFGEHCDRQENITLRSSVACAGEDSLPGEVFDCPPPAGNQNQLCSLELEPPETALFSPASDGLATLGEDALDFSQRNKGSGIVPCVLRARGSCTTDPCATTSSEDTGEKPIQKLLEEIRRKTEDCLKVSDATNQAIASSSDFRSNMLHNRPVDEEGSSGPITSRELEEIISTVAEPAYGDSPDVVAEEIPLGPRDQLYDSEGAFSNDGNGTYRYSASYEYTDEGTACSRNSSVVESRSRKKRHNPLVSMSSIFDEEEGDDDEEDDEENVEMAPSDEVAMHQERSMTSTTGTGTTLAVSMSTSGDYVNSFVTATESEAEGCISEIMTVSGQELVKLPQEAQKCAADACQVNNCF